MKVAEGPWNLRGRGFAVVLTLASGERAEVGDRLRRADGATWVLSGVDMGLDVPIGACLLRGDKTPAVGDELLRAIDVERKAWARLVKAERALDLTGKPWETDAERELHKKRCAEGQAARQALRDLGVDVDALLEES